MKKSMTLRKLHKNINSLKEHFASLEHPSLFVMLKGNSINRIPLEEVKVFVESESKKYRDNIEYYFKLNRCIEELKEELFLANAKEGVSKIIAEIDLLKSKRAIYKKMLVEIKSASSIFDRSEIGENSERFFARYAQIYENLSIAKENSNFSFRIYLDSVENIEQEIGEISRKIGELEDKRDEKNATIKVEVEVDELFLNFIS